MRWGAVLVAAGMLLLAGCDSGTAGGGADRSKEWSVHEISGQITLKRSTGMLALNVLSGRPSDLAISCRSDGRFLVRLETRPETDGKTVELSAGGRTVMLPKGERVIDEAVLALLSSDQPISAKAGDIALGPFTPPFDNVTDQVVGQCRKWMKTAPAAPVSPAPPKTDWSVGTELGNPVMRHDGGTIRPVPSNFTLICGTNATFGVHLPGVKTIGSEDRLSVGVGDQILTLVVEDLSPGASVRGVTVLDRGVVETLETGKPIAASYGRHQVGPIPLPDPDTLQLFTNLCRGYMKLD